MQTVNYFDGLMVDLAGCDLMRKTVDIDGHDIKYWEAGTGTPLVLIHGLNIGWGQWYQNFAGLARHFRVMAMNLPGSGQDSGPHYRMLRPADYRSIISGFVRKLNLQSAGVVGHSFGSTLALYAAIDCPQQVARVVLAGPLALSPHLPRAHRLVARNLVARTLAHTVVRPTPANLRRFLQGAVADPRAIPQPLVDYYATWINGNPRRHPFLFMSSLSAGTTYREGVTLSASELRSIRQPVLMLAGSKDTITPLGAIQPMLKFIPRASLHVLEGIGHVPNLEAPGTFNDSVTQFAGVKS